MKGVTMTNYEALKQAAGVYAARGKLSPEGRRDAAVALADWGIFSMANIAAITDLGPAVVKRLVAKADRTGGRLNPATLGDMLKLAQAVSDGTPDEPLVATIVDAKTSVYTIAKLTGIPVSTLKLWYARAPRKEQPHG
jgi:hypothetical protein